jgi:hypothetical protein
MKRLWLGILVLVLSSCQGLACTDHSNDPKSCRERVAKYISTVYPDPVNLGKALDIVCAPVATLP